MYKVKLTSVAQKGYENLTKYKDRVNILLDTLKSNPWPYHNFDLVKLNGLDNTYRVRIGKIRIKYQIREAENVILVFYIDLRKGAYD